MVRLYDVEVSGNRLVEKNLVFFGYTAELSPELIIIVHLRKRSEQSVVGPEL